MDGLLRGVLGIRLGAWLYAEAYPLPKGSRLAVGALGKLTLPGLLGVNHWVGGLDDLRAEGSPARLLCAGPGRGTGVRLHETPPRRASASISRPTCASATATAGCSPLSDDRTARCST